MPRWPWRMIALVAVAPFSAFAVLDATVDECKTYYGTPTRVAAFANGSAGILNHYHWNSIVIGASFPARDGGDDRCGALSYEKVGIVAGTGAAKLSGAEIESILALNAGGSSWVRAPRGWSRKDGHAFVYEFTFERDGIPTNQLAVFRGDMNPQLAARVVTAPPPR